jgi:hypothetical protein
VQASSQAGDRRNSNTVKVAWLFFNAYHYIVCVEKMFEQTSRLFCIRYLTGILCNPNINHGAVKKIGWYIEYTSIYENTPLPLYRWQDSRYGGIFLYSSTKNHDLNNLSDITPFPPGLLLFI